MEDLNLAMIPDSELLDLERYMLARIARAETHQEFRKAQLFRARAAAYREELDRRIVSRKACAQ